MIFQIEKEKISSARYLFEYLENFNLNVVSFFEGNLFGELYANDIEKPTIALLFTSCRCFYLAGNEKNDEFNLELKDFISKILLKKYSEKYGGKSFRVICDQNWKKKIFTIFTDLEEEQNHYYVLKSAEFVDWQKSIPEGYTIVPIDERLVKRNDMINYSLLPSWMQSIWDTAEKYLQRGFGFSVIHDDKEIASVVFCNYIDEKRTKCELGVVTFEKHRKKGLAKILTAATIDYCLDKNIYTIDWHCRKDNIASIRIANSLGFVLKRKYIVFNGVWKDL